MIPDSYRYGGGATDSTIHPFVAVLCFLAIICILTLPRRHASLPLLWMTFLVSVGQQFYIAGIHMFALRLVIGVGVVRALLSPDKPRRMTGVDTAFLICAVAQAIGPILLFGEGQTVVYEIGYFWDWVGGYWLCRWLIQDEEDILRVIKYTGILIIPIAVGMAIEQWKLFNIFSIFGELPVIPSIREGKVRAQGVFEHSLTAGFVAAVIVPWFMILWKSGRSRLIAVIGLIAATGMMLASNSSTTYSAYGAVFVGLLVWWQRYRMRRVRQVIVGALVCLQCVMKAPIWFLLARVDITGGSSGYHRATLVDSCIRHFTEWFLIGTNNNVGWGLDMFDVQDQYVNVAYAGGLVGLVCFIMVISRSFGQIGRAVQRAGADRKKTWLLWLLGCALFANVVGFFGVNYFDQSRVAWFLLLAMISASTVNRAGLPGHEDPKRERDEEGISETGWYGQEAPVTV
jgi:hypothetical protein